MHVLRFVTFVMIIGSCNAQPQTRSLKTNKDDNTLLWEISGNGLKNPSFLFGTFHLLCRDDIHFSSQLISAVKNAGEIYMEMDMDDPATLLGGLGLMQMTDGKNLKDLFTPGDYERLEVFFKDSLRSSLAMFQKMKPAFLSALLYPKMMPCKTPSGVEEELMKLAKENKKEIQGFETMAFQSSVFDSIPYEEQAAELLKTIDSLKSYKLFFDTLITEYKSQHLDQIEAMFSKSEFGMEEHQDLLLNDRNRNWVDQLNRIMKKESVFVAIGAGHLVGEMGLIVLLRKEGYRLRPLENVR